MTSEQDLLQTLRQLDFDVESGIELCGGDSEFYCDLIREFHDDVLPLTDQGLNDENLQARMSFAHKLKGTLVTLGNHQASQLARDLEIAIRAQTPHEALSERLSSELGRIRQTLTAIFNT